LAIPALSKAMNKEMMRKLLIKEKSAWLPTNILYWQKLLNHIWNSYEEKLEFVTGGVELLKGHCTDIPADQGSWKRICAICSFWRLFTIIMTKSVEVFQFSFWKTKLLIFFFLLHKNQTPGITMQYSL